MKEKIVWRRIDSFTEIGISDNPNVMYYKSDFEGIIKFVRPKAIFDEIIGTINDTYEGTLSTEIVKDIMKIEKGWVER